MDRFSSRCARARERWAGVVLATTHGTDWVSTSVFWNVLAFQRHAEPDTIGAHVDHMARGWVRIWRHGSGKDAPRGGVHVMTHSAPEILVLVTTSDALCD